ncbi:hypothetical protein ACQJBY_067685 [Aegilops geniculata]
MFVGLGARRAGCSSSAWALGGLGAPRRPGPAAGWVLLVSLGARRGWALLVDRRGEAGRAAGWVLLVGLGAWRGWALLVGRRGEAGRCSSSAWARGCRRSMERRTC